MNDHVGELYFTCSQHLKAIMFRCCAIQKKKQIIISKEDRKVNPHEYSEASLFYLLGNCYKWYFNPRFRSLFHAGIPLLSPVASADEWDSIRPGSPPEVSRFPLRVAPVIQVIPVFDPVTSEQPLNRLSHGDHCGSTPFSCGVLMNWSLGNPIQKVLNPIINPLAVDNTLW